MPSLTHLHGWRNGRYLLPCEIDQDADCLVGIKAYINVVAEALEREDSGFSTDVAEYDVGLDAQHSFCGEGHGCGYNYGILVSSKAAPCFIVESVSSRLTLFHLFPRASVVHNFQVRIKNDFCYIQVHSIILQVHVIVYTPPSTFCNKLIDSGRGGHRSSNFRPRINRYWLLLPQLAICINKNTPV